jgi:hypothetical protein
LGPPLDFEQIAETLAGATAIFIVAFSRHVLTDRVGTGDLTRGFSVEFQTVAFSLPQRSHLPAAKAPKVIGAYIFVLKFL